jgi:predicted NBD/HSP70 family sugar kinase
VLGLPSSDPEDLARALAGVRRPSRELRATGRFLGLGLASVVNAFNIELIVLGGTLRSLYPVVQAETDAALQRSTLAVSRSEMRLVLSQLGEDAALFGAAELAMEPLFSDPVGALAAAADRSVGRRPRKRRSSA